MNLDDFIIPTSIASPVAPSPSPPVTTFTNPSIAAIPIKNKKASHDQPFPFPPASAPFPPHEAQRSHEFDYVQRRVRKTSIDDIKVVIALGVCCGGALC